MRKLIVAVTATFALNFVAADVIPTPLVTPVVAQECNETCQVFRRQMEAPAYTGPRAATTVPVRCAWVASNAPTALVLRSGRGVKGPALTSWRLASLNWEEAYVQGHKTWLANICFEQSYLTNAELTLCGQVGHSVWREPHMAYLRQHDVKRHDPACVGGNGYCEYRGL